MELIKRISVKIVKVLHCVLQYILIFTMETIFAAIVLISLLLESKSKTILLIIPLDFAVKWALS